jgi:beta-glucosidase
MSSSIFTPVEFPVDFLWGAATAAYQVEGSPLADGAGVSSWHRFVRTPGRVRDGDTGDIACDHYRRWPEDLQWMRRLGLRSYRFSISWSRILPEGRGRMNPAGLAHYERKVDALLEAGITPNITLYHWDLPAALDDRGGWLNPDIADWFADYAGVLFKALGDRVPMWATLNEPWVITDGGYLHATLAPGHRSAYEAAIAARQLMRSHGKAVQAFRALVPKRPDRQIGLVVNIEPKYLASGSPADQAATARADAYMNRQYLDPALRGRTPAELPEVFGEAWVDWTAEELALAKQPIDFVGINYYTRAVVKDDPNVWLLRAAPVRQPHATHTETAWEVYPPGLTDTLVWFKQQYGDIPVYVTENGSAFYDPPSVDTPQLEDPLRVDYLRRHLRALHAAREAGVDLRGYYAWSLLDNLEWAHGYSKRFGLLHVDYATQKRTPKATCALYAQVIATQGRCLNDTTTITPEGLVPGPR